MFCPEDTLTRAEMAVFIARGVHGTGYIPSEPTEQIFADVPITEWYAKWVHQLWQDGYTAGCGTDPLVFCPEQAHSRAEATVFFLRMLKGKDYQPPAPTGLFTDVSTGEWYAKWVESAYRAGLIPPCQTALELRFCPEQAVTRAMAAYMMVLAKELLVAEDDLVANNLEVTQAIQDLNNSIRLVAQKNTFVRFHVSSTTATQLADARLYLQRENSNTMLTPVNNQVEVQLLPDRNTLDHAFLFELPDWYTLSNVSLTAIVNPSTATQGYSPLETDYTNNSVSTSVTFETVPTLNVIIYKVGHEYSGTFIYPDHFHALQLEQWLRHAFPIHDANIIFRSYLHEGGLPDCEAVNSELEVFRAWDIVGGKVKFNTRYYGMVDDSGDFMRGCANIALQVASGPTGIPQSGHYFDWDQDGSYGDWYGAHELAHSFGRSHVQGGPNDGAGRCGDEADPDPAYPHDDGRISQDLTGDNALFGFEMIDQDNFNIYDPE